MKTVEYFDPYTHILKPTTLEKINKLKIEVLNKQRKFLSDKSFGHDGSGGQVGFADPASKVGFGFVTNLLGVGGDTRATSLIAALRDALVGKN